VRIRRSASAASTRRHSKGERILYWHSATMRDVGQTNKQPARRRQLLHHQTVYFPTDASPSTQWRQHRNAYAGHIVPTDVKDLTVQHAATCSPSDGEMSRQESNQTTSHPGDFHRSNLRLSICNHYRPKNDHHTHEIGEPGRSLPWERAMGHDIAWEGQ